MWARQRNVYLLIPASFPPPLPPPVDFYDNKLPSSANQLLRWLHELCAEAAAVRRSAAVAPVFVCSPPACGRPESPAPNDAPIFLLFSRWSSGRRRRRVARGGVSGRASMNSQCYTVAMDLGVCQLRNFSISFLSSVLGKESASLRLDNRYRAAAEPRPAKGRFHTS